MKSSWITRLLTVTLAVSMTACGSGFKGAPSSSSSSSSSGLGSLTDTKAIESAAADAQVSIDDASLLLASVDEANQTPGLSKTVEMQALSPSFILDGFKGKLSKKLDAVLAKVAVVKARLNDARAKIADAIAKIDTSDPRSAALVAALTSQMEKLDQLEQKFYQGIQLLTDRMDMAAASLDKLADLAGSAAGSINPIFGGIAGLAAQYMISQIKDVIAEFKAKLLAL